MSAPIAITSHFAQFARADIKGGEHAASFRRTQVQLAFEQAFKGNYTPINEAAALTEGKAKKARAYAAGFAAVLAEQPTKAIAKVSYVGALSAAANTEARKAIETRTNEAVRLFFVAFDAVMAEKPVKKAPKVDDIKPAADAAAGSGAGEGSSSDSTVLVETEEQTEVAVSDVIATAAQAVLSGVADADDIATLRAALAQYDAAHDLQPADVLLTATPALLQAQAH